MVTREHIKGDLKPMATIEFKNLETQQFFETIIQEEEMKQQKISRMLYLVKAGLVWESC